MHSKLTENDYASLREALRRCSPSTLEAAIRFREKNDVASLAIVVFGIIERYQPATAPVKLSLALDQTRLIEDLGLDSLTFLEIVMTIEDALKLPIENHELREIRTLSDLNNFLRAKIRDEKVKPGGWRYNREELILILPQQPPFLFIDSAEIRDDKINARYAIKGDEFFLEGHFKDDPIFPASIVFEALGQAGCLWVIEEGTRRLSTAIQANQVFFASLDGAQFYRKTRPGEVLDLELNLIKLREPLTVFAGQVTCKGENVARIERLVLAFGDASLAKGIDDAETSKRGRSTENLQAASSNGHI